MSKNCQSCGKENADDAKFCKSCGTQLSTPQPQSNYGTPPPPQPNQGNQANTTEAFSSDDIEKNKTIAGLAYLVFFLPLIAAPESSFGRFHANQGLLLLIVFMVGSIVFGAIPLIGWILMPLFNLALLAFGVMGLVNGLNGQAKELPLFGKFRIIK